MSDLSLFHPAEMFEGEDPGGLGDSVGSGEYGEERWSRVLRDAQDPPPTGYRALDAAQDTGAGTGSGAKPDPRRSPVATCWPRRPSAPPRDTPISEGQKEARALGRKLGRTPEDGHPKDPTPGALQGAPFGTYGLLEPLNDSEIHCRFEELVAKASHRNLASLFTFDDRSITQAYSEGSTVE